MRIIPKHERETLPRKNGEKCFVEAWFSLLHSNSSDSFRVRSMNPVNILEELKGIIQNYPITRDTKDILFCSAEALKILEKDITITKHFKDHFERLQFFLKKVQKTKQEEMYPLFLSFIITFLDTIEQNYKKQIWKDLENAIEQDNSKKIFKLTSTLLSVWIYEGSSIDNLFPLYKQLLSINDDNNYFNKQFSWIKSLSFKDTLTFKTTFRIEGFTILNIPKLEIAQVSLSEKFTDELDNDDCKTFAKTKNGRFFATVTSQNRDAKIAGMEAQKYIEDAIDVLRYEMEKEPLRISKRFISRSGNEGKVRLFQNSLLIPNRHRETNVDQFNYFINNINKINSNPHLDNESKRKIKSAFHYYRIGKDEDKFENKFLNWWIGLEYLCRSSSKETYKQVGNTVSNIMIFGYIIKHLSILQNTLNYCYVYPSNSCKENHNIEHYSDLNKDLFFEIIRDSNEIEHIERSLDDYPYIKIRAEKTIKHFRNAKNLRSFIFNHKTHLEWHIKRIYRLRCDIVHSAEHALSANLLAANLEHYLKTVLNLALKQLSSNPSLKSLAESFQRIKFANEQILIDLKNNKEKKLIRSFTNPFI